MMNTKGLGARTLYKLVIGGQGHHPPTIYGRCLGTRRFTPRRGWDSEAALSSDAAPDGPASCR